jgi:hypothetical protein
VKGFGDRFCLFAFEIGSYYGIQADLGLSFFPFFSHLLFWQYWDLNSGPYTL